MYKSKNYHYLPLSSCIHQINTSDLKGWSNAIINPPKTAKHEICSRITNIYKLYTCTYMKFCDTNNTWCKIVMRQFITESIIIYQNFTVQNFLSCMVICIAQLQPIPIYSPKFLWRTVAWKMMGDHEGI